MISLRDVPLSGDNLVDWVFKQFVFFLRRETLSIERKKKLRDPDCHRKILWGLLETGLPPSGKGVKITLNSAKRIHRNKDEETATLIHELAHFLFGNSWERYVLQVENILFERFTPEQINYLKSFIPRHEVKN